MYLFWYLNFANNDHATYLSQFRAKTWNLSFKTNSTQTTDTHRECKDWFAKVALQKLKAQTEISDSYLFFEMTYLPRKRAQRKVIDRPTCWFVIDWYCRTVLTIVKMKELLSNYSSVYKRRDNFFVYKGQSIMGLILEVDRIGLSHGEAVW